MTVTIIAAIARNGIIGRDNKLPWRIPEDLKRFKRLTLGHPVIMGRRTWESLGRPLPGRDNIVITRSRDFAAAGCRVVHSLDEALAPPSTGEVFVIGGAEIYAMALPHADRLQLTEVDEHSEGDTRFPEFERSDWQEVSRESHAAQGAGEPGYDFVTYERRRS